MKKSHFIIMLSSILFILLLLLSKENTYEAFSFFPLDDQSSIESAGTTLKLTEEDGLNKYGIQWKVASSSDKKLYLRQDVSLLFDNGRLRGVKSKWVQNTDKIQFTEKVLSEDSSFFQALTFHHGENHYPNEVIRSVQKMSYDELYVIDSPTTPIASFENPGDHYEADWKELLDRSSKQQLLFHWHQLLQYFDININHYSPIPLVDLYTFHNNPLPNMSQAQTNTLIGRLWEGLYKNYIIPAIDPPNNQLESYVPLILLEKNNSHLLVLFELNGKKEKLIQRIPD